MFYSGSMRAGQSINILCRYTSEYVLWNMSTEMNDEPLQCSSPRPRYSYTVIRKQANTHPPVRRSLSSHGHGQKNSSWEKSATHPLVSINITVSNEHGECRIIIPSPTRQVNMRPYTIIRQNTDRFTISYNVEKIVAAWLYQLSWYTFMCTLQLRRSVHTGVDL